MAQQELVEAALRDVEELLLGEDSIPVQLRAHQGLDRAKFDRLARAIELLTDHYRGRKEVPKRLALAFVDISNYFYFNEGDYPPGMLEEIEDAAHKLTSVASELFSS